MSTDTATTQVAQDITARIEGSLYGSDEVVEPTGQEEEVVTDDVPVEELPEGDDTELEEEEGSEDEVVDQSEQTLADYLGVDEDRIIVGEDGSVNLKAIIDGESKEVPLAELTKSFQLQGHVNKQSMALADERKQFEEQRTVAATELKTRLDGMEALGKVLEQQVTQDFQSIDWDRLRAENPSEWSALRQEFAERAQKVQRAQALIQEEGNRQLTEQQAKAQGVQQEYLKGQMELMLQDNPEWKDTEKFKADTGVIKSFLSDTYGFSDDEFKLVTDNRLLRLIKDAKAYHSGTKAAQKKVEKSVPKFVKPGATPAQKSNLVKARAVKAKRAKAKETGKVQDVANVLLDRM